MRLQEPLSDIFSEHKPPAKTPPLFLNATRYKEFLFLASLLREVGIWTVVVMRTQLEGLAQCKGWDCG